MKKHHLIKSAMIAALCTFFAGVIVVESCQNSSTTETDTKTTTTTTTTAGAIIPQNFPSNIHFPVDTATIYQWLKNQDTASITDHAWDIWAGLTANSGQVLQGDSLLVFETWFGVKELVQFCSLQQKMGATMKEKASRTALNIPHQFAHAQLLLGRVVDTSKGFGVYETVSYNVPAANFATSNLIFRESTIKKYWDSNGIGAIPVFPHDAITTKPTYYAGTPDSITGMIRVPVWPGSPKPARVYPDEKWSAFVFVDTTNSQPDTPGRVVVPIRSLFANAAQKKAATVNLKDFIHFRIDSAMAAYLNNHQDVGNSNFRAGNFVLLVGMHVGTKEISNWTWQTFYWSPNPQNPLFPASAFTAGRMPKNLNGAASHYALATAYAMVWPNQPITNGSNASSNTPIVAFNPYLEAGLTGLDGGLKNNAFGYKFGCQTNCMSCHALAAQNFGGGKGPQYTTDQYVNMADTAIFKGMVQLDFAWSVQGNIIKGQ